jgi:chromosome segregation ATPase
VTIPRYSVTMLAIAGFVLWFVGCDVNKEEHKKTVLELAEANAKLDKMKAELAKLESELKETRTKLDKGDTKSGDMEKALTKARNQLKIANKKHKQEKQALEAPLAGARNELAFLRQKLGELTQNYLRTFSELDMTKCANEILREQMSDLTNENYKLKELLENQEAGLSESGEELNDTQSRATELSIELFK